MKTLSVLLTLATIAGSYWYLPCLLIAIVPALFAVKQFDIKF